MSRTGPAAPLLAERTAEPLQAAHGPSAVETPPPGLVGGPPGKCPLSRVAMVRGSDSEASEGGGFYAARKNGIHGAVDLNGRVGESVFAVANGKVIVAQGRSDWGKLGKTVILDHLDGGYTVYGHLHMVEVKVNSTITAGDKIG